MSEIGEDAESVGTNSESLAKAIEKASCETCKEVNDAASEEVRRNAGRREAEEPVHVWRDVRVQICALYMCTSSTPDSVSEALTAAADATSFSARPVAR